ncbi:hypothetical protein [Mumia zhuanghuii]|uniref:Uncharacterized protein n=1 Tax=Mumia zhuanghuii TaxID=2585211 RepID=A0A5C4LWP2_9ACTN|nr:hypothetical protein [Mumia zhuanghuii]TNC22441.1 hypothetical protein FHE65_35765 [Mumia zhuanghuii]
MPDWVYTSELQLQRKMEEEGQERTHQRVWQWAFATAGDRQRQQEHREPRQSQHTCPPRRVQHRGVRHSRRWTDGSMERTKRRPYDEREQLEVGASCTRRARAPRRRSGPRDTHWQEPEYDQRSCGRRPRELE